MPTLTALVLAPDDYEELRDTLSDLAGVGCVYTLADGTTLQFSGHQLEQQDQGVVIRGGRVLTISGEFAIVPAAYPEDDETAPGFLTTLWRTLGRNKKGKT